MNDLDAHWAEMLEIARRKAADSGRSDVADYLRLKAENDLLREAGVRWLVDSLIELATDREQAAAGVSAERFEPHSFTHRSSNIVGTMLTVRHGVRCLTLEAGWTRTPADGFMKGGALAVGRLTHFGMPKHNCELALVSSGSEVFWAELPVSAAFDAERLRRHFELFLGS